MELSKFNTDASHLPTSANKTIGEETYYPVFYNAFARSS